jgi:hypothetical protein
MLFAVAVAVGLSHLLLFAALWGTAASYVAEFLKQDGWPKPLNTIIANAVVVVSAAFATLINSPGQVFTLHAFWSALLVAFSAALVNHQFFLVPTGIGAAIKRATSIVRSQTTTTTTARTTGSYPPPGPGTAATSAKKTPKPKRPVRKS